MFPQFRMIRIDDLIIDDRYQRELDRRWKQIARNFDPLAFDPLMVSDRGDGTYAVIDGQHRMAAAAAVGIESVPCMVATGLAVEDEARQYVRRQELRKGLKPLAKFKAQLVYGDPTAIEINQLATASGWKIGEGSEGGLIRAVGTLQQVHGLGGARLLDRLLKTIHYWQKINHPPNGMALAGMGMFLHLYEGRIDERQLLGVVHLGDGLIMQHAKAGMSGGGGRLRVYEIVVDLYNRGLPRKDHLKIEVEIDEEPRRSAG